jgi:uncharacterized protein (UPF0212 family)
MMTLPTRTADALEVYLPSSGKAFIALDNDLLQVQIGVEEIPYCNTHHGVWLVALGEAQPSGGRHGRVLFVSVSTFHL